MSLILASVAGVEWVSFDDGYEADFMVTVEPAKPPPEIPPPCWDARPIDADRAIAAVRDMARGTR